MIAMNGRMGRRALLLGAGAAALAGCAAPAPVPTPAAAPAPVDPGFTGLETRYDARLGVFALDTGSGASVVHRGDELFPMCSTFKVLAVGAILYPGDAGILDEHVTYSRADLLSYAPITTPNLARGMSVRELCDAAIRYSDNTAANLLLRRRGGPGAVTALARSLGDPTTRLDRTEPGLNEALPGDPRDTTTPDAIGGDLQKLVLGSALTPTARDLLTGWLRGNTTGAEQIRAGVPRGWTVGDKTGSGSYGTSNDIAVLWPPTGSPVVLSVLTTRPTKDATADNSLLAAATRAALAALFPAS